MYIYINPSYYIVYISNNFIIKNYYLEIDYTYASSETIYYGYQRDLNQTVYLRHLWNYN